MGTTAPRRSSSPAGLLLLALVLFSSGSHTQAARTLQQGRTQAQLPPNTQYFPSSCAARCKFDDDFHSPLPEAPSPDVGDRVDQWANIMLLAVSFERVGARALRRCIAVFAARGRAGGAGGALSLGRHRGSPHTPSLTPKNK